MIQARAKKLLLSGAVLALVAGFVAARGARADAPAVSQTTLGPASFEAVFGQDRGDGRRLAGWDGTNVFFAPQPISPFLP